MFDVFARALAWFYDLVPSYLAAIVLLTIAVRLVLFPLTAKQARSMQKMQQVQPELKRLQAKYKNDRQKLNEEMMKFYKENQINPLAGCLPLLLQMPLFFVLYRVIRGLSKTRLTDTAVSAVKFSGDRLTDASLRAWTFSGAKIESGKVIASKFHADVFVGGSKVGNLSGCSVKSGVVNQCKVINGKAELGNLVTARINGGKIAGHPAYIPHNSGLYHALEKAGGKMLSFGVDLAQTAGEHHSSFAKALPFYVLVALVVATGYYQQRQMTAKNPQAAANPQAQMMGRIFPAFFGVISLSIPAGVVVYFVVSNVWQIGQQAVIFRGGPTPPKGGGGGGGGGGKKPGAPPSNGSTPNGAKSRPTKPISAKSTPTSAGKPRPKGNNPRKGR